MAADDNVEVEAQYFIMGLDVPRHFFLPGEYMKRIGLADPIVR